MAFSSKLEGKEVAITMAFHAVKPPKPRSEMPTQLAKLITNDQPDVLALGYAPATPDYGKTSPFESILKPQPDEGRFVPPIGEKDHEWAATPLPPSAFSKSEQTCLAEAVYYEARGETVKGRLPSRRSFSTACATRLIRARSAAWSTRIATGSMPASFHLPATARSTA